MNEEAKPVFDLTTSSEVQAGHICQSISSVVKKKVSALVVAYYTHLVQSRARSPCFFLICSM